MHIRAMVPKIFGLGAPPVTDVPGSCDAVQLEELLEEVLIYLGII